MRRFLQFTGPVAQRVLLPSDPKLAMDLAAVLLNPPRMINLANGLWGYSGFAADEGEMTVQSSGLGGPSTAIVAHELCDRGMRRLIRIGRCVALDPALDLGEIVIVQRALVTDGASARLGGASPLLSAPTLLKALNEAVPGAHELATAGVDLAYDPAARERRRDWLGQGASIADLATGAVLAKARELSFEACAVLLVDEDASGDRMPSEAVDSALLELGSAAAGALSP